MGLSKKSLCMSCCRVKHLSELLPFIHISHRVFVELMTYCMSVLRAQAEGRQLLVLLYSACHLKIQKRTKCYTPNAGLQLQQF